MMIRIISFEREQSLDYFDILKELSFLTNYIHVRFLFSLRSCTVFRHITVYA